jgi:hypothetical protein
LVVSMLDHSTMAVKRGGAKGAMRSGGVPC